MAKIKLTQLSQHGDLLDRYGARVRILGQRSLLKPDVLEAMDRACNMTAHNDKTVLNVCFPYTSRDEITTAIRETVQEYSKPIAQPYDHYRRQSPFTEEKIRNTLKSQHRADDESDQPRRNPERQSETSPSASSTSISSDALPDKVQIEQPEPYEQQGAEVDTSSESSLNTTPHPELLSPSASSSPPTSYMGSPQSKPQNFTSSTQKISTSSSSYPNPESITSQTIESHLFTASDPPLDLLIRTSGVQRLSDFMLWQCHEGTRIVFLDVLWPEFDLWQFLPVLWEWQWRGRKEEQRERLIDGQAA